MTSRPSRQSLLAVATLEWPTMMLALLIHAGWIGLTLAASALPWWAVLPMGAWLTAWHMSLQHELIHGHPTRLPWLNDLLGSLPVSLWLPYRRYKRSHLGHHAGTLTDPLEDPESHYVTEAYYASAGRIGRWLLHANTTLLGRLVIGPARGMLSFLSRETTLLRRGDAEAGRDWLFHLPGLALVLVWLLFVCHLPLWRYALLFAYPGYALALLRSFAEHRAADATDHRTAIVERAPVFGLLFLHNNLHVVHHARPGLAWYRIPAAYRADRRGYLRDNDGLVYRGYPDVARRYLLRPHDAPWLPCRR